MIKNILRHKTLCRSIFMMAGFFVFCGMINNANAAPTTVGTWTSNYSKSPEAIAVKGNYAYVAGGLNRNVAIVNISNPANPTLTGNWSPNDFEILNAPTSIAVSGNYAYVTGGTSDNVLIVDISNPASPSLVGNLDPNNENVINNPQSIAVSGDYAYILGGVDNGNVTVVDISDPVNPYIVHNWISTSRYTMQAPRSITIDGNYAYIVCTGYGDKVIVMDISNPTSPTVVANKNGSSLGGIDYPTSITVQDDYAYVYSHVSTKKVTVLDVSNPVNPSYVSQWNSGYTQNYYGGTLTVAGDHVFAAGYRDERVAILDVSNKNSPSLVATWDVNTSVAKRSEGIVVSGDYAYVARADLGGFAVIDVSEYVPETELTITEPNQTKLASAITDGHITVGNGTSDSTTQSTTAVNLTFASSNANALFPTSTVITEKNSGNYNLERFTITDTNVSNGISAIELGIPGTDLNFSQDVTVTINVGETYNDQTLNIYSQKVGQTDWTDEGTCTISEGNCTFTTNHATTFVIGGNPAAEPIDLNVEVKDTLTLDCFDTTTGTGDLNVTLGTAADPGKVTAGTPATGQSTCTVTTNDDQGYYLTLIDDNASANTVLTHTDPHTGATYEIQDLTQFPTTQNWTAPTTKGLGFSVVTFPDTQTDNNTLDETWTNTSLCPEGNNPDTNTYAGIPDTAETISAVTQYESLSTTTNICYKVDVPASQASGQYTGSVTYTATSDASSYLN